jgi:hypothetical protein
LETTGRRRISKRGEGFELFHDCPVVLVDASSEDIADISHFGLPGYAAEAGLIED